MSDNLMSRDTAYLIFLSRACSKCELVLDMSLSKTDGPMHAYTITDCWIISNLLSKLKGAKKNTLQLTFGSRTKIV